MVVGKDKFIKSMAAGVVYSGMELVEYEKVFVWKGIVVWRESTLGLSREMLGMVIVSDRYIYSITVG
jgi:hypothetical protein